MKEKSLRQLARELGVSASYLSQVKNGKRPPSERILTALNPETLSNLLGGVKQSASDTPHIGSYNSIRSAELCSGSTGDFGFHATHELINKFLKSRRQGLSLRTIKYYDGYLTRAHSVVGLNTTSREIASFLDSLRCSDGGKLSYFRVLRAFYNWLYSLNSDYNLNAQDNPILRVEPPKLGRRILPSPTAEEVNTLISHADCLRDKCIISLFYDSGMRLSELANILPFDFDWDTNTVIVIGKGNKQRRAPFTKKTAKMLRTYLKDNHNKSGNIWGITARTIEGMLEELGQTVGIKCNPHAFRRGFACNLHRKGLSTLDIMHLGGWENLSMVLRYTKSITFDDCLVHYQAVENKG